MSRQTKSQPKNVTVKSRTTSKVTETSFRYTYQTLRKKIKKGYGTFWKWAKAIPGWLRARPAAIKHWRREDRKKKKYRSFHLQKRLHHESLYVPSTRELITTTFKIYYKNFWVFFCIMFVHATLYIALVHGNSSFDLKQVQATIQSLFGKQSGAAGTAALLGTVVGSQSQREGSAFYNFCIILMTSLAYIWVIRKIISNKGFRIRDGFYQGMAGFIPVIIILFIMTLQAIPFSITAYAYVIGRGGNLFISGFEDMTFFLVAALTGLLSLYWMTTSIISLYAVTLPGMYPIRTLRLTKKVVKFRKLLVFRRIVALPAMIILLYLTLLLGIIKFAPQLSPYFAEALPILLLPLIHIYLFKLYRSLI